jgi:hypothetical protein
VAAVPIKPHYGPTLGRLLSPRWRAASTPARAVVILACAGSIAVLVGGALTLLNATYSHAGSVPFSFSYRSLYRVRPDPGGYVKVQRHRAGGALEDSFAVEPLTLPPYSGSVSGELPLYAERYIRALAGRTAGFVLRGEGKTRLNTGLAGYQVVYEASVEGRTMWGRDVLLLPERPAVRRGVDVVMLTSPHANARVTSPLEVATAGVLQRPLKSFSFG